jgi:hypothetical protein
MRRVMSATSTNRIEEHLQELELELLRQMVRQSPELLSSLLADEFREFGSSGNIFSKNEVIEALRTESRMQFSISDFRAQILGDGVALVTYQAVRREEANHAGLTSLRSSLWVIRDDQWRMLFHQGTPVPEG